MHVDLSSHPGVWGWTWEVKHKANKTSGACLPPAAQGVLVSNLLQGFDFLCQNEPTGAWLYTHMVQNEDILRFNIDGVCEVFSFAVERYSGQSLGSMFLIALKNKIILEIVGFLKLDILG